MKAFTKGLVILLVAGIVGFVIYKHRPDFSVVYPDQCKFTFDENLSLYQQTMIKQFIDACYKEDKNPQGLLSKIEEKFPIVESVRVDMNDPDLLQFTIHAYRPLFVLNDHLVICQGGHMFEVKQFAKNVIADLKAAVFTLKQGKNDIKKLANFVDKVSSDVLEKFHIRWLGKHNVWLEQKEHKDLALLVDYSYLPTIGDVGQCEAIKNQMYDASKKHKQATWVCDLRFEGQVVVFSKKKGE